MSQSQEATDNRALQLQEAINQREMGDLFELKELFEADDWLLATDNLRLAKSITGPFKRRIAGWPGSVEPCFTNLQVCHVEPNGRERMFRRIQGPHTEEQ